MTFVSYAQNFEDVILWRALKDVPGGFYIDIGAQDPVVDSVSLAFYQHGWRGIHVEPSHQYSEALRQARPDELVEQAAVGYPAGNLVFYEFPDTGLSTADADIAREHRAAGFVCNETSVPCVTLDQVLALAKDRTVHWMKIDVEGSEKQVLEGWLESAVRPWILVIESTRPLTASECHSTWEPLVTAKGYRFAYFDGLNRFYVAAGQEHLLRALAVPPNVFDGFALSGTASNLLCRPMIDAARQGEQRAAAAERRAGEAVHEAVQANRRAVAAEQASREAADRAVVADARAAEADSHRVAAEANAEAAEVRAMQADFQAQLAQSRALAAEARAQALLDSWSWRLTAPLRKVAGWAIKSRRSFRAPRPGAAASRSPMPPVSGRGAAADGLRAAVIAFRSFGGRGLMNRIVARLRQGGIRELVAVSRAFVVDQVVAKRRPASTPVSPSQAPAEPAPPFLAAIRPQSSPRGEQFRLAVDHSMAIADWDSYLNLLLANRLPERGRTPPEVPPRLVIVVDCTGGTAAEADFRDTLSSVDRLAIASTCPIALYWLHKRKDGPPPAPAPGSGSLGLHLITGADLARLLADDDRVLWLKPGDEVRAEIVQAMAESGVADAELTLVDMYRHDGNRVYPLLLNGVDPVLAESCCYFFGRFLTTGRQVAAAAGRDQDLTSDELGRHLACRRDLTSRHLPLPLIHVSLRGPALQEARTRLAAREPVRLAGSVSAIVCTKDSGLLLEQLVNQLLANPAIQDVVVVANNPANEYALAGLARISTLPRCLVLDFPGEFNFSRQSNLGARHARGTHFLFINDDIAQVTAGWLDYLLSWMDEPRIAGPLLIYPDQSIQHAGMFLGFNGVAGHALRGGVVPDCDPGFLLAAPRQVAALTGAVLLMPRDVFEDLNGFDVLLGTYLQDVDLCLRAAERKIELVFDPRAILIHMESVSIRPTLGNDRIRQRREREFAHYLARWGERRLVDRHLNPLIDRSDESLTLLTT